MDDDAPPDWPLEQREFRRLLGLRLDAVEFVMDYLRLQWGEWRLSILRPPVLHLPGGDIEAHADGFRDGLCGQIGRRVTGIHLDPARSLEVSFEGGARLEAPLKYEGAEGMEILLLSEGPVVRIVLHGR